LYGGIIPFGGTFLTFSDYARNAIRLSALMKQRVVYVYTHDSIGLGEDGPTHQPVEQIPGLRMMPGLSNWRPCDTIETAVAWRFAIEREGPTCLMLSRQNLPFQKRTPEQLTNVARGGYVLAEYAENRLPQAILIATGSEVAIALEAAKTLSDENIYVRVVSMPSTDVFLAQPESYQQDVLPDVVAARVAIEAASADYWYRFVGRQGGVIGLDRFGASAPAQEVYKELGITAENVVRKTREVIRTVREKMQNLQRCAGV